MNFEDLKVGMKFINYYLHKPHYDGTRHLYFCFTLYEINALHGDICTVEWLEYHTLQYDHYSKEYYWNHSNPTLRNHMRFISDYLRETEATEEAIQAAHEQMTELMLIY